MQSRGKKPITEPSKRFFSKVKKIKNGCWEWKAQIDVKGYGRFFAYPKMMMAHRWSYEFHKGAVPDGLQIDHLCRNRKCVNPDHLEAVTGKENCRRGLTGIHLLNRPRKTKCNKGHSLPDRGVCPICREEISKRWYSKRTPEWHENHNRKRREARAEKGKKMNQRKTGIVKFFDRNKGFGFLVPDDGGRDVFVHVTAVEKSGLKSIEEGHRLEFALEDRRGKVSAVDLKKVA